MSWRLMPHQEEGVAFLLERGSGLIAFEQGLGKTLVAIETFRRLRAAHGQLGMLVLCPNSLKANWVRELRLFAPELSVQVVPNGRDARRRVLAAAAADVVLVNYEGVRREIMSMRGLLARRQMVLTVDESHAVKNAQSLTAIATSNFAHMAVHRWFLSGTPVTNSPTDIHTQLSIVAPHERWGSSELFEVRFGGADRSPEMARELNALLAPHVLRRTKQECLQLPDKEHVDVPVPMPAWQRAAYDDYRTQTVSEFSGMSDDEFRSSKARAFASLVRLQQLASDPTLLGIGGSTSAGKDLVLDDLLETLMSIEGQKVIIWCDFVQTIERLQERHRSHGAVSLYGKIDLEKRATIVEQFQNDSGCRLLVANAATAGTGLTLTAATVAIYYTLSWRYDFFAQSQDRIHRIGQDSDVRYLRLLADGTIDKVVAEALARKAAMAANILGDDETPGILAVSTAEAFCRLLTENRMPGEPSYSQLRGGGDNSVR